MKKYLISVGIVVCALVSVASAQNYTFGSDLYVGSQGTDVANLQTLLIANGYHIPAIESGAQPKGYFGTQTEQALSAFQRAIGVTANGFFGPVTRTWINTHGGTIVPVVGPIVSPAQPQQPVYPTNPQYSPYPIYPSNPSYSTNPSYGAPVISSVDAPTSLTVNQPGTWSVHASDPANGPLSYAVDWGDTNACPGGYVCTANASTPSAPVYQQTTFTHSYALPGTYTVRFTVGNSSGLMAQTSATVQVSSSQISGAGPLRITSPNGNEVWQKGTTQYITWTSPYYFAAAYADLKIVQKYNCTTQICPMIAYAPYTIATNIPINQNSYNWNVGSVINYNGQAQTLPDGQYTIQICQSGTSSCDSSDNTFTVTSSSIGGISQITVLSPNGGEVWQANSTHQVMWSFSNGGYYSNTVDLYLTGAQIYNCPMMNYPSTVSNCGSPTVYTLDRNISTNTQYNWIVGTDINNNVIPAGNYFMKVCQAGSTTNCDYSSSYFTISGTAYPYYPPTSANTTNYMPAYTPPTYSSGYYSNSQCPAGYVCTPVQNSSYTY